MSYTDCNPDASISFAESEKGKQWLQKGHYSVSARQLTEWNNPNPKPQFNNHHHNKHYNQGGGHHHNNNNRHHHRG